MYVCVIEHNEYVQNGFFYTKNTMNVENRVLCANIHGGSTRLLHIYVFGEHIEYVQNGFFDAKNLRGSAGLLYIYLNVLRAH